MLVHKLLATLCVLTSSTLVKGQFNEWFNLATQIAQEAGADKNQLNLARQIGGQITKGTDKIMRGDIGGGVATAASAGSPAAGKAVDLFFKTIPGLNQAIDKANKDIKGNQQLAQANNIMASIGNTGTLFTKGISAAINKDEKQAFSNFMFGGASILQALDPGAFSQPSTGGGGGGGGPPTNGAENGSAEGATEGTTGGAEGGEGENTGGSEVPEGPVDDGTPKFSLDEYKKLTKDQKWDLIVATPETIFKMNPDQIEIQLATGMLMTNDLINNWKAYSTNPSVAALFWYKFTDLEGITKEATQRFNKIDSRSCTAWLSKYKQLRPATVRTVNANKADSPPLSIFYAKVIDVLTKNGLYERKTE